MTHAPLSGIHHITALAADPQRNLDFYVGFLGMRLVKKTVNFDAPDVYHFYYGDETGTPGTLLTFFPFPYAERGKRGAGEITSVAFAIPPDSMVYWVDRLAAAAVHFNGPSERFGGEVLSFEDPDGMTIELVPDSRANNVPVWSGTSVDRKHALRSLYGATLTETKIEQTEELLLNTLGFSKSGREGNRHRFILGEGKEAATIDILHRPELSRGEQSAGSVHHIAWRIAGDEEERALREELLREGTHATEVINRIYFHSVYFREPGGVLFEIATDGPGMLIDEPGAELGRHLKLPPWLEESRHRIEQRLLPVTIPHAT